MTLDNDYKCDTAVKACSNLLMLFLKANSLKPEDFDVKQLDAIAFAAINSFPFEKMVNPRISHWQMWLANLDFEADYDANAYLNPDLTLTDLLLIRKTLGFPTRFDNYI